MIGQLLALGFAAFLASGTGAARGARSVRPGVVAHADAGTSVCLRFVGPWARRRASRLQSDLETTFRRRAVSFGCGVQRTTGAETPPSYQLSLVIEAEAMREVTLAVNDTGAAGAGSALRIERYVDLRQVPVDGRNLAVVVAADELLDAARRRLPPRPPEGGPTPAAVAPPVPPAVAASAAARPAPPDQPTARIAVDARAPAPAARPVAPPVEPERPAAEPRPPAPERPADPAPPVTTAAVTTAVPGPSGGDAHHAAAMSFAVERYTGGQTHLGPELAWSYGRDRGMFAVLAVGMREGLVVQAMGGAVASSLWSGRLALGTGVPLLRDRLGVAVEAGVRLGQLRLQGRADTTDVVARTTAAWLCYAAASASLRARIAGPVQARLEAGVGLPLLAQRALEGTQTVTAASGVAAHAQVGAMVVF